MIKSIGIFFLTLFVISNDVFLLKVDAQNQNNNYNNNNFNRKNGNKKVNHIHQNHNFEKYFDHDSQQNNLFAGLNTRSASELNDQCHLNIDCGSIFSQFFIQNLFYLKYFLIQITDMQHLDYQYLVLKAIKGRLE